MHAGILLLGAAIAVSCDAASGQDRVATPQITTPERELPAPAPVSRDLAPAQVALPGRAAEPAAQVTAERRGPPRPAQLSSTGTAEPPTPLSRPADGRTVTTTRIAGRDRCDPAGDAKAPVCAAVIETRSGDYARPDPLVLSPEQRLLVDQRLRAGQPRGGPFDPRPSDADKADPETLQGQTIGAIVRGAVQPESSKPTVDAPTTGVSPETLIVIDAILGAPQVPK